MDWIHVNVIGHLVRPAEQNLTVRAGRRPALDMEQSMMNGNLVFDLAKLARNEQLARVNRAMLIREARGGQNVQISLMGSVRRVFGGAIISLGQRVRGERRKASDVAPSSVTLRMAR
jgi:hypothetical protein